MNKHILLVMKWLKNPETVTQEELEDNFEAARSAVNAANRADADADYAADYAYSTASAARAARAASATRASYWIDEYFKYTSEDKQIYIDKLGEHYEKSTSS
jgi:hypothetical protein